MERGDKWKEREVGEGAERDGDEKGIGKLLIIIIVKQILPSVQYYIYCYWGFGGGVIATENVSGQ